MTKPPNPLGEPWRMLCILALALWAPPLLAADSAETAAQEAFFVKKVQPLLAKHCFMCHANDKQEGGLRLDSLEAMLQGGDSGPAIVPGNVADSLLVDAVRYGDTVQMPPTEQLSTREVEILVQWIEDGAVWPKKTEAK